MHRVDGSQEAVHLPDSIGEEDSLEVIAIAHAVADARADSVDVFQHSRILDTRDVGGGFCLHIVAGEHTRELPCHLLVTTSHGEIGKPFERHLLSVRRSADAEQLPVGHAIALMEIV